MLLRTYSATPSSSSLPPPVSLFEDQESYIAGLSPRAWYDATNSAYRTAGTGSGILQLTDRSGNGFHLVQATPANQPVLGTDYFGVRNGVHRDAVVFDGTTDLRMATAGNVFDGTTVWSMMIVCNPVSTAGGTIPFSPSTGSGLFAPILENNTKMTWIAGGTGVSATLPTSIVGQNLVMFGTYNYPGSGNVALTIDANGYTGTATPALGTTAPGTTGLQIGSRSTSHDFKFNGGIAELILFEYVLSTPQIAGLRACVTQKYG